MLSMSDLRHRLVSGSAVFSAELTRSILQSPLVPHQLLDVVFHSKLPPSQLPKLRCIQLPWWNPLWYPAWNSSKRPHHIKLEYKTRLGFGIIIIRLEASVAIAFQYQFTTTVNQETYLSPLQVLKALDRAPVRLPGACLISARYAQSVSDIGPGTLDSILNASYG
ncbi:UNVERIFIED_CONTAM: hypothetical protein Slati_3457500 [Sesamum latifolium]|uniref:Uncharacterized protein n=1 Tax=Sesamum latifolium TaxID=2727402 RepID=A0AAW2UFU7_9LAMI